MPRAPTIKQVERCIHKCAAELGILRHPWRFRVHSVEKGKLDEDDGVVQASCGVLDQYKVVDFYFDLQSPGWDVDSLRHTVMHELAHVIVAPLTQLIQRLIETQPKESRDLLTQLATDIEETTVTIIERIPALGAYDEQ